jgi:hypothetical protein
MENLLSLEKIQKENLLSLRGKRSEKAAYINNVLTHFNTLNAKLNPICHFLALLGAHHFLHVSRVMFKK